MDRPTVTRSDPSAEPLAGEVEAVVVRDGAVVARLSVPRDRELRIGSRGDADIALDDATVSRDHAQLRWVGDEIEIKDLGSKNGTWIGEGRIDSVRVRPPVSLRIGDCVVRLVQLLPTPEIVRFGALVAAGAGPMRGIFEMLRRVADHDAPILVLGETGTGKDLIARGVHACSRRASAPFVVVDLAALAAGVIESELFGHVRGAFTGAVGDRAGAFESAGSGTVFLDEIGEMPIELQPRLLRVLESGEVKRVGGNRYLANHARVIAATNRDLTAEEPAFREDLYHRLAVVVIQLPPLRDRPADIPILVDAFVGARGVVPRETMQALVTHDWPGNVRQLRHVLERALILAPDGEITLALLGLGHDRAPGDGAVEPFKLAKQRLVDAWEREYVEDLVARHANLSVAARKAGIARAHLHRLLRKHDLG